MRRATPFAPFPSAAAIVLTTAVAAVLLSAPAAARASDAGPGVLGPKGEPPVAPVHTAGAAVFEVGGLLSSAGKGVAWDLGLRYEFLSLRWCYRVAYAGGEWYGGVEAVTSKTWRIAAAFPTWGSGGHLYVGAGGGMLRHRSRPSTDGDWSILADASTLVIDAGALLEPFDTPFSLSVLGLGVEWHLPLDRFDGSTPTLMVTATISPFVLAQLK
jgi:hypothetical protein